MKSRHLEQHELHFYVYLKKECEARFRPQGMHFKNMWVVMAFNPGIGRQRQVTWPTE